MSNYAAEALVGEPEVLEDVTTNPAWLRLKSAATALQVVQTQDGSVPNPAAHADAAAHVEAITAAITELAPLFPHDADYLAAVVKDFARWVEGGFGVPDFLDSLMAFRPEQHRVDGLEHLVVFPMYTQNGSPNRLVEAVLIEVIWPDFVAELEAGDYSNKLFVPIRFLDFTAGYDTNSAVLFPETVAMREVPTFTWGAIFADREAARFRRVVRAAAEITRLELPADAARAARRPAARRGDLRHVGPHPRPHAHARRPAVRPVHDQAADAVLPVLARGAALRPDRVPRVGAARTRRERRPGGAQARQTGAVRRDLRPDLPVRDHRQPGAQLRRPRRPAAVRVAAPAPRAALDRHPAHHRLGRGSRRRDRTRRPDRRAVLALDRPAEDRALARRLRAGLEDADPEPGLGLGPRARCRSTARRRASPTRCCTTSSRCRCSTRRWTRR